MRRSIVVRVSTPSASILGAHVVLLHEVPGHQLVPERPRGGEDLAGVVVEVLLLGRPRRAHDRVAVEQQRHAAGELAVLAVVLDEPEPVRELALGVRHEREAQAVVGGEAAVALVVVDADADERDVRGRVVVEGAVELDGLQRAAVGVVRGIEVHDRRPGERPEIEPLPVARNQLADRKLVADLDGLRHERPLLIKPA